MFTVDRKQYYNLNARVIINLFSTPMGLAPFSGQIHAASLWVNVASVANVASTNTKSPMRRRDCGQIGNWQH